jgi:hypothetical protein
MSGGGGPCPFFNYTVTSCSDLSGETVDMNLSLLENVFIA